MTDPETSQILRVIAALVFVLALMGGFLVVLRKMGYTTQGMNSKKRLKLVEILHLDNRRKLAIIQRDEKQHLVILGQNSETVIESGIESAQDAAMPPDTNTLIAPRKRSGTFLGFLLCLSAIVFAHPALAQTLNLDLGAEGDGTVTGRVIQMVALLTVLSLAPSILIMMTSFTRVIVVLSFLRTAIGVQQTPPNAVMISLALFLTFFIMAPTFQASYESGIKPLMNEEIDEVQAFKLAVDPFQAFMLKHVREKDLELFMGLSKTPTPENPMALPIQVVIPAFMISELRRAFEIGFMLFLPFLIIDLVTASILMSMGMMMLPPVTVSLPFKIIFFVLADGWYLIAGSLIQSFDVVPLPPPG